MPNNSDPDIFGAETQMKTRLLESEHLLEGECSLLVVTGLNRAQSGGSLQHKAQQTWEENNIAISIRYLSFHLWMHVGINDCHC